MPKDEIYQQVESGGRESVALRARLSAALEAVVDDPVRAATLRLVKCAIRDRDISAHASDRCGGCGDDEIYALIATMVEQRQTSIKTYEANGRADLAEREREEVAVLKEFLPRQLSASEVEREARDAMEAVGATGLKDLGRCMAKLRAAHAGRMDFRVANRTLKRLLT